MSAPKPRAPTLYVIVFIKLLKGVSLLLLAFELYKLVGSDLSDQFDHLLQWIHIDPEKEIFSNFGDRLDAITPANLRWVASGTVLYSLFSLVEGIGLMFRVSWAGWLAIGESAFFIPIEIYKLSGQQRFSLTIFIILLLNIFIVLYLYRNRERLFHHAA